MMTSMPDRPLAGLTLVTDPATERHEPNAEIWVGVRTPGTELPARVAVIRDCLEALGAQATSPRRHDDTVLAAVHSPGLLAYLRTAAQRWDEGPYAALVGQDRVVPYVFPTEGMLQGLPLREPVATHARAGRYCYDTMTLIGPGTWEAARNSVDIAQSAAELALAGGTAYGLCRPPGHHATREAFGGSCYLNNAAVAAETMRAGGLGAVAVIDMDAHHGNGTQSILYDRGDILYGSVHVDPGAGWFPHFMGFADETGRGAGAGWTRNLPLAEGSGDAAFVGAVKELATYAARLGVEGLVVSLGVDAAGGDPESPLQVTAQGFAEVGRVLAGMGLPTVLVQEGGYDLAAIGPLVAAVLTPFAAR
jgi:acetoin utilization deacetylase AcuC-like enzyme